jgi:carbamoyltransferase
MSKPIAILGIHDGHNSGATLVLDGTVVASVSEERLTRQKNEVGYPEQAIADVLRIGGVDPADLDEVVYASLFMHARNYLTDVEPWYKVGIADQRAVEAKPKDYQKLIFDQRKQERIDDVVRQLGVAEDRVSFVEHHLAHLTAAYYTAPWREPGRPVLGITCDGAGDNLCATVTICRDNDFERIAKTGRHASLGKIYSRVTFLLGMTPWEHEYKIMGMAPYAEPERAAKAAQPFRDLLGYSDDGLGFALKSELSTNFCYEYLREAFERVRFDTICGAVQCFIEEMLVDWVKACVAKTGIRDIVAGGGVFMNVKANKLIADLPEVDRLYVMPSGGDESLSIGAALYRHYQRTGGTDHKASRIDNLYWGASFDVGAEEAALAAARQEASLVVSTPNDMNAALADLLASGETVALCRGRMEWGARALGNRSIVTSANDFSRVDEINRAIKKRDFWMPFAPSIREEAANRYIEDGKDLKPWFMTLAYAAREEGYKDIIAGSHPRDRTLRPQVVTARANPDYHAMISGFDQRTGRGAVLNTSFNLHGEPIVYTPGDALRVLRLSGLKHLALNNFLITKAEA